jgi:signal transduction histidine kinase
MEGLAAASPAPAPSPAATPTPLPRWQRLVLPGELLGTAEGRRRSVRDWVVDVLMYLIAIGLGIVVLATTWSDHSRLAVIVDVTAGVVAIVALWFRRAHPVTVGVLAGTLSIFSGFAGGAALLALFNVALRGSRRGILAVVGLAVVSTAALPLLYAGDETYAVQLLVGALVTAVVVGWALFLRAQRDLVLSLRERAARLEAERRLELEQAREAERLRIAREMHDVLAHRVSLLSLHAGALEFRPDAPAEEIAEAAAVIRASASAALEELRDVIGVLRDGDPAPGEAPEPPQPTLAEVPALVDESRRAGVRVEWELDVPDDRPLPASIGRAAYRIVQEGLTNARKHAPGAAVDVRIAGAPGGDLVVEVRSRRAVAVGAPAALPGAGTGLVGLAERVALAGGTLEHGPDPAGDFVLRATLPWPP